MPVKSKAQQGYIFSLRNRYKTKEKTPKKYNWIWEKEWENVPKNLPEKTKKENIMKNKSLKLTDIAKSIIKEEDTFPTKDKVIKSLGLKTLVQPGDSPLTSEQKNKFIDAVSNLNTLSSIIYKDKDELLNVTEDLKAISTLCEKVMIEATKDSWFDQQTIKKDVSAIQASVKVFEQAAKEMQALQTRLESAFDDIGLKLNKYFEIK